MSLPSALFMPHCTYAHSQAARRMQLHDRRLHFSCACTATHTHTHAHAYTRTHIHTQRDTRTHDFNIRTSICTSPFIYRCPFPSKYNIGRSDIMPQLKCAHTTPPTHRIQLHDLRVDFSHARRVLCSCAQLYDEAIHLQQIRALSR